MLCAPLLVARVSADRAAYGPNKGPIPSTDSSKPHAIGPLRRRLSQKLEKAIRVAELRGRTVGWIVDGKEVATIVGKERQALLGASKHLSDKQMSARIAMVKALNAS